MNKKDFMNLESLFILSAIAHNSGKRQASKEYNTSVDTINKYIDNLENELGYKLLSTNGRGSVLTPRAESLVKKVDKINQILTTIYNNTSDRNDVAGEVRIGTSLLIGSNMLSHDIGVFADKYPELSLSFFTATNSEITIAQIAKVDIALTLNKPEDDDLVIIDSQPIECGFFASPAYLSYYGYPVDIEDMANNHRILHKEGLELLLPLWGDIIKQAKRICYRADSPFLLIDAMKHGLGISILPVRFREDGLVKIDTIKVDTNLQVYLVAHKNTKDIPRIRTVLNYCRYLLKRM